MLSFGNLPHSRAKSQTTCSFPKYCVVISPTFPSSLSRRDNSLKRGSLTRRTSIIVAVTMTPCTRCWRFWRTKIQHYVSLLVLGCKSRDKTTAESSILSSRSSWATAACTGVLLASYTTRRSTMQSTLRRILPSSRTSYLQRRKNSLNISYWRIFLTTSKRSSTRSRNAWKLMK